MIIILKQNSYAGARRMRNETIFLRALKKKILTETEENERRCKAENMLKEEREGREGRD